MKKNSLTPGIVIAAAAITGCAHQAYAQSMDYGSLQELFGEPVTTGVTGTPQRASEVAANMTIITADEIRQSGSRQIPQILGIYVPGLDILQSSISTFDVGVRGYQQPFQPRLLVLIDGRQVFVDDYSRTQWDNLPVNIDDIRQIEVVKGPASALFGSNAAGGVVNIITYHPFYDHNNVAAISAGTQSTFMGDVTATQHLGDWGGVKLSGGGNVGEGFNTSRPPAETKFSQDPSHHYGALSSVVKLDPDVEADAELTFSQSVNNGASIRNTIADNIDTNFSVRGGFAWQSPYGLIKSNNYLNHSGVAAAFTIVPQLTSSTDLVVSQLEDQFKIGTDNTFRTAVEYRHKSYQSNASNNIDTPQTPELDQDVYAADGTWLWQIADKLSWTNALRVDHSMTAQGGSVGSHSLVTDFGHTTNEVSANSGLVYQATDLDTLRATYGRGIQYPSLIQYGTNYAVAISPTVISDTEGNPLLKPTVVQNYELGYDRGVPGIFSTAKMSVYYMINQDLSSPPTQTVATRTIGGKTWITQESVNIGNSQGWGSEIELQGKHPSGFRWDASYSWSRVADAQTVANVMGYSASAPENQFRLSGGYTTGAWEFDANGQLVTSTDMFRSLTGSTASQTPTDGYISIGGRIGYNIDEHFTVALSATNINQNQIETSPYPAAERQAFMTLTGKF